MKHSLKGKLILSYLAVALLTVVVVSILIRLTSGQSLMNLVVQQQTSMLNESAQVYYTAYGTMDGFYEFYLFSGAALPNSDLGRSAVCMGWWMQIHAPSSPSLVMT